MAWENWVGSLRRARLGSAWVCTSSVQFGDAVHSDFIALSISYVSISRAAAERAQHSNGDSGYRFSALDK